MKNPFLSAMKTIAVRGKAMPEPKYRNPVNPRETWHGGRGPKPKWVREFLGGGGALESIAIRQK